MLEIGTLVDGKYKILNVVGKGGMSVVYQAVNEKANKIWAIKEVRKDGVQNYEVVKQNLIVETDMLKRLNHPNLPSIIDVIDTDDSFLIVMDYIEGNSLSKALETSGAQNQDDVIEWSKQLCDVLGYLHSRRPPIIYRDMKPANVMLKPDGNVSLIDFGTAREFKSTSVEDTTCLGTQGYAAPEQYGGHGQTDARTDIYCLGATMYHLVTGHNPSTPPYEMYPIRQWNPMLSSGLEEIITKCTQRNPNDRYQSCAELLYALDHYQDLDIENKKAQNLKWKVFLTSAIITIVMLLCTVGFKIASNTASASEYDAFISTAENALRQNDTAAAKESYKNAIDANDAKPDAYQGLLEMYTSDGILDKTEYDDFVSVMRYHGDNMKAGEKEAYASFCYDFGTAVLFMTNDNDAPASANWYNLAKDNFGNSNDSHRADLMARFAQTYQSVGKLDPAGNPIISPREFYDNVMEILKSENFDALPTIVAKVKCCQLMAIRVDTDRVKLLENGGLTANEYNNLVASIEETINRLEQDEYYQQVKSQNASLVEVPLNDAKSHISKMRDAAASVFSSSGSSQEGAGDY